MVDDNKDIRKLIKEIIEIHFEVVVIEAEDGLDAYCKLANENIDILMTDLKMPQISGAELILSLKKNTTIYQPKYIIVFSGAIDDKFAKNLSEKGMKTFTKPVYIADLVEFLSSIGLKKLDQDEDDDKDKKGLYQKKTG